MQAHIMAATATPTPKAHEPTIAFDTDALLRESLTIEVIPSPVASTAKTTAATGASRSASASRRNQGAGPLRERGKNLFQGGRVKSHAAAAPTAPLRCPPAMDATAVHLASAESAADVYTAGRNSSAALTAPPDPSAAAPFQRSRGGPWQSKRAAQAGYGLDRCNHREGSAATLLATSSITYRVSSAPSRATRAPAASQNATGKTIGVHTRAGGLAQERHASATAATAAVAAAAIASAAVADGEGEELTNAGPLRPFMGLAAKEMVLRRPPAHTTTATATGVTSLSGVATRTATTTAPVPTAAIAAVDPTKRIPVATTASAGVIGAMKGGLAVVKDDDEAGKKELALIEKLYASELAARAAAIAAPSSRFASRASGEELETATTVAGPATYFSQMHIDDVNEDPIDYQLCFHAFIDPAGAEAAWLRGSSDSDADGEHGSYGRRGFNANHLRIRPEEDLEPAMAIALRTRGRKGMRRIGDESEISRNTPCTSTSAAVLLQDPRTLLACEHLLDEEASRGGHKRIAMATAWNASAPPNSGGENGVTANGDGATAMGTAPRSWMEQASVLYSQSNTAPVTVTAVTNAAATLTGPLGSQSVLRPVPPPGEVFVELSYAARVLLSAVLYVRALGGFPTLLRAGPLTDVSPVTDKENCIELVFWNPTDAAVDARVPADQGLKSQLQAHAQSSSASLLGPNEVQNRLVRTLSAVMATGGGSSVASPLLTTPSKSYSAGRAHSPSLTSWHGLPSPLQSQSKQPPQQQQQQQQRAHGASSAMDGSRVCLGCERDAERSTGSSSGCHGEPTLDVLIPRVSLANSAEGGCQLRRSSTSASFFPTTTAATAPGKADKAELTANELSSPLSPLSRAAALIGSGTASDPLPAAAKVTTAMGTGHHPSFSSVAAQPSSTSPRKPPGTPTGKGSPYILPERDDVCIVLRAVLAHKSAVRRFGREETVHVLPPLPRESDDIQKQASRDAALDRLAMAGGNSISNSPLYRFLYGDTEAERLARARRAAVLAERRRRLAMRPSSGRAIVNIHEGSGNGSADTSGASPAADYGDLVVALLLSGAPSQLSGVLPDAAELEALRYRIFTLHGYQPSDPLGIHQSSNYSSNKNAVSSPGMRGSYLNSGGTSGTAQGFAERCTPATASLQPAASMRSLRRESSFQAELSRAFGYAPNGRNDRAGTAATAAIHQRQQQQQQHAEAMAAAFPLYRASSISERTLAAVAAAERNKPQQPNRSLYSARGAAPVTLDAAMPLGPHTHATASDARSQTERDLTAFRPFTYSSFYSELRLAVQHALDTQLRQAKSAIRQAHHT